ncbi:protein similar-like, partial [Lucilia sericata]|uniref:protein similar-like n=1 Tax=Lucilia sericata TaxID=13632 RepID=UPI0018A86679
NNEKRKERSRDAARCRRSRETEIFTELAQVLPLKKEDVQQLDKASVMRIAIAYLKVRDMLKMFPKIQELLGDLQLSDNNTSEENSDSSADTSALNSTLDSNDSCTQSSQISEDSNQQTAVEAVQPIETTALTPANGKSAAAAEDFSMLLKQTLDGFLLILSNDGDITYVSGNISDYLGLSKIDILGQQIWEYAHQCDHAELKEALNIKRNGLTDKVKDEHLLEEGISTDHRDLFVRLKCTITSRGRSINIKSASYKVIHITGHLVVNTKGDRVLVAMGRPIPHPSNIEVPLGTSTFLTKHSLDMKFTYVDDKMLNLLGYKPEDLLETSLFNCHHGMDSDSLMTTFKN